ncbi:hypothetical protein [Candidatus Avelusimicrobium caledoniensis]|uniref:hypothetical protein n=1 Tax=Candidatus Avelusimicrobium caledoniensis TaxID=3416220 RepID=UPI003D143A6A
MSNNLVLSALPHTWIFDVDGTLCVHNGYKNGGDKILDGVKALFASIPPEDMIVILTSRQAEEKENLEHFLLENGLRFNHIIFGAPMGERILINDDKPSGLKMTYGISKKRDAALDIQVSIDKSL